MLAGADVCVHRPVHVSLKHVSSGSALTDVGLASSVGLSSASCMTFQQLLRVVKVVRTTLQSELDTVHVCSGNFYRDLSMHG